jgi:DNA invertase Pin-like site-specific DNA recombinase
VPDGDVLIVWKLDRLVRSLPHLIETVTSLAIRGVGFHSITEAIDTTTPGGRLVFHLFGALGQFERDLIQERTRAGLATPRRVAEKADGSTSSPARKLKRARAIIAKGLTVREAVACLKVRPHCTPPYGNDVPPAGSPLPAIVHAMFSLSVG